MMRCNLWACAAIVAVVCLCRVLPAAAEDAPKEPQTSSSDEVVKAKAVLDELTQQASAKRDEIKKKQQELDELNLKQSRLEEQLKEAEKNRKKADEIILELEDLKKRKRQEEDLQDTLRKEADGLDDRIKDKKDAYKALVRSVEELQTRVDELQKKLDEGAEKGIGQINDKITVTIDGTTILYGGGEKADLRDVSDACKITISLHQALRTSSVGTLQKAGIEGITLVEDVTGHKLDISARKFDVQQPSISLDRSDVCDPNRKSLSNRIELRLRVQFRAPDRKMLEAEYYIRYVRSWIQGDLGIATYFAGGALGDLTDATAFAIFPAFRIGARFNIPVSDDNRDFYLQPNAIAGGGFVVASGTQTEMEEAKILSIFFGATLEVGKYVEAGYAMDPLNKAHLVVIAPGRVLSSSIFTF